MLFWHLKTLSFHLYQEAPSNVDNFGTGVINTQATIRGTVVDGGPRFHSWYQRMFLKRYIPPEVLW